MRFTTSILAVLPLLSTLTLASPTATKADCPCIPSAAATSLVSGFASLLTNFNAATANTILAPDFTDVSDSINFLAGIPLGSTTFPSKGAFIGGQGAQPSIGLQVLGIDAITCNVVVWRWSATVGSKVDAVKGVNVMYVSDSGKASGAGGGVQGGWQIETNYSEFNSGAWVVDIGGTCQA